MKSVVWDPAKNEWLKATRGVSFEQLLLKIASGDVLDTIQHTGDKFTHQRIFIVEFNGYAYLVPFVESDTEIFLKTIFPSRKATKKYLGRGTEHGKTG